MRGNDQHLDFDLELAKSHSNDNPVYYIQYAHARICALMRQLAEKLWSYNRSGADAGARACSPTRRKTSCSASCCVSPKRSSPPPPTARRRAWRTYLRELAASFHSYYNAVAILVPEEDLRSARLGLCQSSEAGAGEWAGPVGVSAPEKM
jgi:arginyl-tRNA synthetase